MSAECQYDLMDIITSLSSMCDLNELFDRVMSYGLAATRADAGSIYIVDESGEHLEFVVVHNKSLGAKFNGRVEMQKADFFSKLPLTLDDGCPNLSTIATYSLHTGETVNISDSYASSDERFEGVRSYDAKTGYTSKSILAERISHQGATVGVLQLINRKDCCDNIEPFSQQDEMLIKALASIAAVAFVNRKAQFTIGSYKNSMCSVLTKSEMRVVETIVQVGSAKEVARVIGVSPSTVRNQIQSIYQKLGINKKTDLVKLFIGFDAV
ncbi:GAF domain-containing protein [Aquitalea magnusonii]|uniref:Regulatory LuxR family protein n=1 Tax=Aquitalea magnusonii TaxID=332411 RepID=A0A318JGN8_9NEIS|nr:GAF domain-containing protein [Aquitalea magnusonii]PXX42893.1 regulatory LuxR family protein [Aquitalea magnusonii]